MSNYKLEKYKRNNKFYLAELNIEIINSSTRDECMCSVIGKMTVGINFYISNSEEKNTHS